MDAKKHMWFSFPDIENFFFIPIPDIEFSQKKSVKQKIKKVRPYMYIVYSELNRSEYQQSGIGNATLCEQIHEVIHKLYYVCWLEQY